MINPILQMIAVFFFFFFSDLFLLSTESETQCVARQLQHYIDFCRNTTYAIFLFICMYIVCLCSTTNSSRLLSKVQNLFKVNSGSVIILEMS